MRKTILKNIAAKAVLILSFLIPREAGAQSVDFIDALRYYREGDAEKALSTFRKEIALHPDNDAAYFYMGSLLHENGRQGDAELAEESLRKAVELDSSNYWYTYMLALFYEESGRSELATPLLEGLIGRYPKKSSLYFDTARAYLKQNDIEGALKCIDKIEAAAGRSDMIACTRLDLMIKQDGGKEDRAYAELEKYYQQCRTPRLATMLGDRYQKMFRDSLAINYYNEAIEMDGNCPAAYFGRAHSWQGLRQYGLYFEDMGHFMKNEEIPARTKAEYLQTVMENPQFVRAFLPQVDSLFSCARETHVADSTINYVTGLYYYRTERPVEAASILMQNMNFHPESFTVGFQYLLLLYYSKSWRHTAEVSTILLQRFPSQRDPLLVRASAEREENNYKDAIRDYEAYIAYAPTDSATIMNGYPPLGDAYYYLGDWQNAFNCYKKALKVVPDSPLLLNNYAYFMALQGKNLKKAREMSRRCVEREPDNPTYLDTYAWILHLMGQDLEAKAHFKHAMLYGGKEQAAVLDHYAEVLYSLGETDLARIYWNQAKSLDRDGSLKIDEKLKERKVGASGAK